MTMVRDLKYAPILQDRMIVLDDAGVRIVRAFIPRFDTDGQCALPHADGPAAFGAESQGARRRSFDRFDSDTFGILSEELDAVRGQRWGNVPSNGSMADSSKRAMRLSLSWEDAWCRD